MDETSPTAWQPVTPRGVAAFARAPLRRLLLVQLCVALLVALASAWLLFDAYFPVLSKAIGQLPAESEIRSGRLDWRGDAPVFLAENRFLALSVDLDHSTKLRSVAHVQVEFGRTNVWLHSLFGYAEVNYPRGWIIAANRQELQPRWGAWQPAVLAGGMVLVIVGLFVSWAGLATLYAGPVALLGFFLNRDLNWRSSWKLCGAALLPGALLMVAVLSIYAAGLMDLVQLSFSYAAHLVLGWGYVVVSLFFVPKLAGTAKTRGNPFAGKKAR